MGSISVIRTINGPDLAYPRLRTLAENSLQVIDNRFPVFLVKARSMGKDEGQRLGVVEIGRIRFPIALDGRHQWIGRTRVKDMRLGIKSDTHGERVGTESDKSMLKREDALTKITGNCERSEHLWLRVEGPDKQIQIVAAQMLSVNFYMPHILAISRSFLTKT